MNYETSLSKYFISTVNQRVLSFLSSYPEEKFHEREISRRVRISLGAANKAVKSLWKAGLISRDQRGRMCFYSIQKNPIIRIYKILNTVLMLQPLIEKIGKISHKIVLFGSAANGTNNSVSDIDLFVISDDPWETGKEINRYADKLLPGKIQPYIKSPEEMLQEKGDAFYQQIEKGIVLWEASEVS